MCLNVPFKVISVSNKKIVVAGFGKKREAVGSLKKIKKGDYVLLQNNFVVAKIAKKEAEEIINLINSK